MSTRTINVSEEAYERLLRLKREGESFTDVVNRLTGKFAILDLVGILSGKEADQLEADIADFRQRLDESHRRRIRRVEEAFGARS